jgi:hypothetical protein
MSASCTDEELTARLADDPVPSIPATVNVADCPLMAGKVALPALPPTGSDAVLLAGAGVAVGVAVADGTAVPFELPLQALPIAAAATNAQIKSFLACITSP